MFDAVLSFLRETVAPRAQLLDECPESLAETLRDMGRCGLAALRVPAEYGGPGISESEFRSFQVEAARASGTFAFLQTQHQSAASMLLRSDNSDLKTDVLPKMVSLERSIGIGFSQLRRPGPPVMRAEEVSGGFRLTGTVPWITGFGIYDEFLIGAALPNGEAVFGIVPFSEHEKAIRFSPVMDLAAMQSAQTVSGEFKDWLLPGELVAFVKPAGWIANNDTINITLQGHFAIGCALAGLDIVLANAERRKADFLHRAHASLLAQVEETRKAIDEAPVASDESATPARLELRARVIDLAVRCAHAAVTSSSGAANSLDHPAQRVYREALVFTVSAQTTAVMEATMEHLARRLS